ncbi:hypothetical protein HNR23_004556 [Nocardiopsis mwathae]|uniref:Uncharacterized protein n=1 Tax=Nocardiopsis mwathae TaxID=1472723 RepID=A0A7W9YMY3_9ACTN|nr:hypothetical protein [Nocardiopsis mwathae]MBB6174496.1 hypothetical protein [Nocardiopsis mwathae]
MTPADEVGRIPELLHRRLGSRWEITTSGTKIRAEHKDRGSLYLPPRRDLSWSELLQAIEEAFAAQGVRRDHCLPLRWGRDTDLTISAVQALDPLLKDGRPVTYRQGYIPQPVVRFTGRRDQFGELRDGFLTSFVNVSRVEPIAGITDYIEAIDGWLSVLSRISLHARHISMSGDLKVWHRREVRGVTLHFQHLGEEIGDIVLLWNAQNPARAALDLGSGLERLAWARSRSPWQRLIHGDYAGSCSPNVLDALRTATLLLGNGITPAARGAGAATRRSLAAIPRRIARFGVSAIVRYFRAYWTTVVPLQVGWSQVALLLENGVRGQWRE